MSEARSGELHSQTLSALLDEFGRYKRLAERAFEQLADRDFFFRLSERQNSVYVILKHMAGNMRSRWTDFLTRDGEKPDRRRDGEFEDEVVPREQILRMWEEGWRCTFDALSQLREGDLLRTVTIRGEPMTAVSAIARQLAHYAQHVGQILLLAKHIKGPDWKWLTIPPGESEQYNQRMRSR